MTFDHYKALALKVFPSLEETEMTDSPEFYQLVQENLEEPLDCHRGEWEWVDVFSLRHATKGRLDGSFNFD